MVIVSGQGQQGRALSARAPAAAALPAGTGPSQGRPPDMNLTFQLSSLEVSIVDHVPQEMLLLTLNGEITAG